MATAYPMPTGLTPAARYGIAFAAPTLAEDSPELAEHLLAVGLLEQAQGGGVAPTELLLGVAPERFTQAQQSPPSGHGMDLTFEHQRLHRELGGIRLTTFKCVGCGELFPCPTSLGAGAQDV